MVKFHDEQSAAPSVMGDPAIVTSRPLPTSNSNNITTTSAPLQTNSTPTTTTTQTMPVPSSNTNPGNGTSQNHSNSNQQPGTNGTHSRNNGNIAAAAASSSTGGGAMMQMSGYNNQNRVVDNYVGPLNHRPHNKTRHHHHHLHHAPMQHYHHFHHHWSYPDPTAVVPPPHHGQATFHFGPGFEPQQPLHAPRFPHAHNNAHGGGPSAGSSTGNSEHVVHFHVNPGVTVSFQIGDNMELIRVPSPYGEYYPDGGHYYLPAPHPHQHPHPQELCPHQHHQQLCALHGDYGPVTVPMVSTNSSPPIAMPVSVPPGHVVQQIVDESGALRHIILSTQPPIVPMPPPPHSHNPQHYGPGPANGTNQPPQPFFPQGLAPPYGGPPAHFGGMPPGHLAPPPPSGGQPGHSPPPSGPTSQHNYLHSKDERTQRQYNKLRRKLEQKHAYTYGSGQSTPAALSPRKELVVNGLRRSAAATVAKESRGMSSVGTSEDGEESSSVQDDEDDVHAITDILSSVQSPQVSDISSRSALLKWSVPRRLSEASSNSSHDYDISETDLRYEVLLSDKGKEGKYKAIYSGSSLSCRIQDLRPGQEYSVCLQVHYDELQGNASEPLIFLTPPCEPDQPQPPKLISRSRTSLQLRWNSATDNGSHISHYILECDEGKGEDHFVELSRGRGKQHNLQKLQPTTCYKFRLAAVNECGKSAYSEIASFSTSGSPPGQPIAPILKEARISSLHLTWLKRPNDDDFTLQMDDRQNKHGFLPIFTGKETEYVCRGLRRATEFKFRLRAHNEEGASRWSDEVSYRTLPDRPAQPLRPNVKGKIHAHQFKLKWDPPNDKGGAEICNYVLELNSGSGYEIVYKGPETEAVCDRLTPGTTYQLRVYCISAGGQSDCSEPCTVTTDAICPNRCAPPKLVTKPRSNSISLRWSSPDYNGGAPVIEYELEITYPDSSKRIVYKGKDTECTVNDLLPGQVYVFVVRALNRIGAGPWSDAVSVTSGAAAPNTPEPPSVTAKSPFHIQVEWKEPPCNGSPIIEYKVEISCSNEEENFNTIFQGLSMHHDIKGLMPFTPYYFRLQACNDAGRSPFSPVSMAVTPAAVPAACAAVTYESTPASISLSWHEPPNNGSDILHYNIEIGDKSITTEGPVLEYEIGRLNPDSVYKIKIQAVNSVGPGPFSPVLKATTLPLPPSPPKLECIGIGHNYLKLKWGEGKNVDFTRYCVEIDNPRVKEFQCVYQGTSFTCKVNKLQELTTYRFRISAANDYAGQGDWSEVYEFKTCIAPPAGLKAPKASEITQRTCVLEWNLCKVTGGDPVTYQVQLTRVKDQDFKQVHEGSETKCTLSELDSGAEYSARVCPIRQASSGPLPGAYSPVCNFSTQAPDPVSNQRVTTPSVNNSPVRSRQNQKLFAWLSGIHSSNNKQMSDQQKAIIILIVFTVFAIFAAVLVEQFIIWRQSV